MSSRKKEFNKLFDGMHQYMFSVENMSRFGTFDDMCHISHPKNHVKSNKPKEKNKSDEFFFPKQHDSLFWCFYIVLYGINNYELNKKHIFKTEKDFKISSVDLIRKHADEIKAMKLKVSEIESEIVNEKKISVNILRALALVYEVSILYVSEPTYYSFENSNKNKGIIVFDKHKQRAGVRCEYSDEYKQRICNTHWYIMNPNKPMKAVSGYTLQMLRDICMKIGLATIDNNGKPLTKQVLYEHILEKI